MHNNIEAALVCVNPKTVFMIHLHTIVIDTMTLIKDSFKAEPG